MVNVQNTLVPDGGGGCSSSPQTATETNDWEFDDSAITEKDFELRYPLKINELLYDVSDHYSASFQDFADAMVQIKSIGQDIQENDCWSSPVVKEAVSAAIYKDLFNAFQECSANNDLLKYIDTSAEKVKDDYLNYVDYAMEVEAIVALIENEMAKDLEANEFEAIMEEIQNDDKMNSLNYFLSNTNVSYYAWGVLKRVGAKYGKSLGVPGLPVVWNSIKDKTFSSTMLNMGTHLGVLKEGFHAFLRGDKMDLSILSEGKNPAQTSKFGKMMKGAMGSKLMGGAIAAALVFGINFVGDAFRGEITLENEMINLARAGVAGVSSIAGAAVTEALSGAAFGGVVGAGVAIGISIVGNLIIDKVVHNIKYADNGVPRKYTEINVDTIKKDLTKEGYILGPPKVAGFDNESVYDVFNTLIPNSGNEKLVYYFVQRNGGLKFMSEEEYTKSVEEAAIEIITQWELEEK